MQIKDQEGPFAGFEKGAVALWLDDPITRKLVEVVDLNVAQLKTNVIEASKLPFFAPADSADYFRRTGASLTTIESVRNLFTEASDYARGK
jgi:hypothetical protein